MSLLIYALAIIIPFGFAIFFPDKTERAFRWIWTFKRYFFGTASIIFAFLFLSTGSIDLMLIGALIIATAVWYVFFESDTEVGLNV